MVTVVKEFYANAEDKAPFVAFVRGKQVPFGPEAINKFYNVRPQPYVNMHSCETTIPIMTKFCHRFQSPVQLGSKGREEEQYS